jgi:O-antigen ligase
MASDYVKYSILGALAMRLLGLCLVFVLGMAIGPFILRQLAVLVPALIALWFIISVLRAMVRRLLR